LLFSIKENNNTFIEKSVVNMTKRSKTIGMRTAQKIVIVICTIVSLIFIAAFPSTYSEQSLQQEQEYINQKSYYLSQGCNPETIDSTGHVINWRCPAGTESAEERLFTGNLTTNELCYGDKYVNTKAYAQLCKN
jgi:hypothetical protein